MRKPVLTAVITSAILFLVLICFGVYVFLHGITPDLTYPESFIYTHYDHGAVEFTITMQKAEAGDTRQEVVTGDTRQKVRAGDSLYDNLIILLENNPKGWKLDFNTYAPEHRFYSEDLVIDILGNAVVINYASIAGITGHLQVIKQIDPIESILGDLDEQ